ncbi:MAG: gliding motility-associated C-terminal domain-containing protein, partial [Bacteroidales bacterium]|nr:gliding motility-associated C-terminal domain-containing protein [Candidatus Colimorpha onthohippi]
VDEDSYSNGMTAFDFNLDGKTEMLICDQSRIRVVDGNGNTMNTFNFSEVTIMQYPVIADVDNDGHAEIVSVGSGKLNIFKSVGQPWAPARNVWNQYIYNVTCVNNDLTVPRLYYNNSTPLYDPDGVSIHRPYNNCLQQATQTDQYGRPYYTATNFAAERAVVTNTTDSVLFSLTYSNQGSNHIKEPYHIAIFKDVPNGSLIHSFTLYDTLLRDQRVNNTIRIPLSAICHERFDNYVIVLNNAGHGTAKSDNLIDECGTTNNTYIIAFNPPAPPSTIDNITCCDSFQWESSQTTYYQSGTYHDTTTCKRKALEGCDSINSLNLRLGHTFIDSTVTTHCDTFTWFVNHQTYTASAYEQLNYKTAENCDSNWLLNLTIYPSYTFKTILPVSDTALPIEFQGTTYHYPTHNDLYHYTTINGCDSNYYFTLVVDYHSITCDGQLQFPNIITPNGDGINDIFEIKNLLSQDCYPHNELRIYNRWGICVYHRKDIASTTDFWEPSNIQPGTFYYTFIGHGNSKKIERHGVVEVIKE